MTDVKSTLMTHLIAYYPGRETSLAAAKAMIDGGASYLEVQFPFSDPSADGPVIQKACSDALEAGFSLEGGFGLIREIKEYSEDVPVFLMSYGNVPFVYGIDAFAERCKKEGISGLIIPDLILGRDEGMYEAGMKHGVPVMPVIVPTISEQRLHEFINLGPEFIYVAMRTGITGRETLISESLLAFLDAFGNTGIKVLAGFGVRKREQVKALEPHVHGIIVGSALVAEISDNVDGGDKAVYNAVKNRVSGLTG